MSKLKIPTDLTQAFIVEQEACAINSSNLHKLGLNMSQDPIAEHQKFGSFLMNMESGHYNLYELQSFKFHDSCKAPCFGMRTKAHGTVYPLSYHHDRDIGELLSPVTVFGFQLSQAFRIKILEKVTVTRVLKFNKSTNTYPIFREFDTFMYDARMKYKKEGNKSMAQCVKVFINSLYGKFGEKHHDMNFTMNKDDFENEEKYKDTIISNISMIRGIHKEAILDEQTLFNKLKIKNYPLFDLNDRDMELTRVNVSDIPMHNNHIGAFVYFASIITAIGRTQITQIANQLTGDSQVYYIDTDSIVVNQNGANQIVT